MLTFPRDVRRFARRYFDAGYELYVVGGAVRDALRNAGVTDYDFATSAPPDVTQRLFRRTIPTGIRHGTVTVLFEGNRFEVTTYRLDGAYHDHRRPETVQFSRNLHEDLRRRDFTINAIAADPRTGEIVDPFDGRSDIRRSVIRTVGPANERFSEDALRMLRAVRFSTVLNYTVDAETIDGIVKNAASIRHVAAERIRVELEKIMTTPRPSAGWRLMETVDLLRHIVPELREDQNEELRREGLPEIFPHLVASCDCAPEDDQILRWAALLHDAGKPRAFGFDEKGIHFHGHDEISGEIASDVLRRLRFPTDVIDEVCHLVRNHMFGYTSDWSDAAVRRFISRIGVESVSRLVALRRIDGCGKGARRYDSPDLKELESRVAAVIRHKPPLRVTDLAIGGRDIMDELSLSPGPTIGIILDELLRTAIDDPSLNSKERLLEIARRYWEERLSPPR